MNSKTSLSISKNAERQPIARCYEYFDEIIFPFSSCMLIELLEYVYVVELLEHDAMIVLIASSTNQIYPSIPIFRASIIRYILPRTVPSKTT